ncbi:hypothetical protein SD77_2803 [Bacillus badius]|uniref:Uncharacterized protein n=1 Tax=Bacillus badius TaxID=1455 RepID=A0ABR5APT2_BACBA|nr:hypothetical protein SD78_1147 [Bacillus badius]KIL75741.1 hypothetical protein SD77_2803 [Bacillus badius]
MLVRLSTKAGTEAVQHLGGKRIFFLDEAAVRPVRTAFLFVNALFTKKV